MPTVSVIVPTYNHGQYVVEAIESVLQQTYRDLEVIVVDDGSTDDTRQRVAPYVEQGTIVYFHQANRGLSAARNAGLRLARGRYVKFLDSDDYLYPRQIELQVDDMSRQGAEISNTDFTLLFPDGRSSVIHTKIPSADQLAAFVEANRGAVHSFLLSKAAVLGVGGFDETLTACEDLDLYLRMLLNGAVVSKVDYVGCAYRVLASSMSSDTGAMFLQRSRVFEKLNAALLGRTVDLSEVLKDRLCWSNRQLLHECILRGYDVDAVLPQTKKMIGLIYGFNRRLTRLLLAGLGQDTFLRMQVFKCRLTEPGYVNRVLGQGTRWRFNAT